MTPTSILVVADDAGAGCRLRELLASQPLVDRIEVLDYAAFEPGAAAVDGAFDLLLAVVDFAPDMASALAWVERAVALPDAPPLVVVAEHGSELAAAGALLQGAADYLPLHLLDAPMLAASLQRARNSGWAAAAFRQQQHAALIEPLQPGLPRELIPRYVLLDTLGESTRATVYLALSLALDRHVALKVSRINDDNETQFAREYEIVGGLRDPAVVDIYDYGIHEGREFIAMEYFPCGDLKSRLRNPVSMQESLRYLTRIALALSAVHARGLVHRDLKPPNIMLRENGEIVLIDFGIARDLQHGAGSTRTGVLRGSPYYMSPEQAQGEELDARSDLYSLGVILYEMLTGSKPYVAPTAIEVLQQHVHQDIPRLPPESAGCQGLLDGLMAKDRGHRFASAHALLDHMQRIAA